MEIKFEDYLSQDDIKEIVESELRMQIQEHFKNEENANRLIANLSYRMIWDEVEKVIPNSKDVITKKVSEVVNDTNYTYQVFRNKTSYDSESLACSFLNEAVRENRDKIKNRVVDILFNPEADEKVFEAMEHTIAEMSTNLYDINKIIKGRKEAN